MSSDDDDDQSQIAGMINLLPGEKLLGQVPSVLDDRLVGMSMASNWPTSTGGTYWYRGKIKKHFSRRERKRLKVEHRHCNYKIKYDDEPEDFYQL